MGGLRELKVSGRSPDDVDLDDLELVMRANAAANAAMDAERDARER